MSQQINLHEIIRQQQEQLAAMQAQIQALSRLWMVDFILFSLFIFILLYFSFSFSFFYF